MQTSTSRQIDRFHARASIDGAVAHNVSLPVIGQVTIRQLLLGAGGLGVLLLLFGVIGSGGGDDSRLPTFTLTPTRS